MRAWMASHFAIGSSCAAIRCGGSPSSTFTSGASLRVPSARWPASTRWWPISVRLRSSSTRAIRSSSTSPGRSPRRGRFRQTCAAAAHRVLPGCVRSSRRRSTPRRRSSIAHGPELPRRPVAEVSSRSCTARSGAGTSDEESYVGPILAELDRQRHGVVRLVGVGPRTNFRIRRWSDRVAEFGDPAARDLPLTPVESFAGWPSLAPSRKVWADRRATRDAFLASPDIRSHAIVDGIDLWPLVATELGGIADLQFPWSARAMDEAGAALDHLEPGAVLTYAEAGGWGRAIMLEARRRGIATIGAQHGFIYRHWLNYLHEPDEMAASPGNAADAGFPHPTCTLLFDGFAQEHLRRNGHFPDGSTVVTGSTRLEQFVRTAAALTPADREAIRRDAGGGSTGTHRPRRREAQSAWTLVPRTGRRRDRDAGRPDRGETTSGGRHRTVRS